MQNLIQKILDYLLGPEAIIAEAGFDPSQEGLKTRASRKTLLIICLVAGIALCLLSVWGASQVLAAPKPTATEFGAGTVFPFETATLPAPGVGLTEVEGLPTQDLSATPLTNILTLAAALPTNTPSPTLLSVGGILTGIAVTQTPCTATHFLTQLVCDDLAMTATIAAMQPGEIVNVSGVDPKVTIIYPTPYPNTATPYIITATPSATPVVITATQGATQTPIYQVVTATPGPTQTPWFFITQPPVITVVWTQLVTVVVTATETETATPTETPTETPTP